MISQVWVKNGGIVGRGVLLDWADWESRNNVEYDPFQSQPILLSQLQQIIKEQSIGLRPGDILLIRAGYGAAYDKLSPQEQQDHPNRKPGGFLGLEATRESLKWLWDNRFAAVASDAPGFERQPSMAEYNDPNVTVHQVALAGWGMSNLHSSAVFASAHSYTGMPLGEMFDLEELAEHCRKTGRRTFFLSSVPINVSALSTKEAQSDM